MLKTRWVTAVCALFAVALSGAAQAPAAAQVTAEQKAAVAKAKGLAGTWDLKFSFKGHELETLFTFEVDDVATPPPEVRVRFHGARYGKNTPNRKLPYVDGEIIDNHFSFTSSEKAGKEWKVDQLVSVFVGSFDGDKMTLIYLNTEDRDPAGPNRAEPGAHRTPPPEGDFNMHVLTGTRVSKVTK